MRVDRKKTASGEDRARAADFQACSFLDECHGSGMSGVQARHPEAGETHREERAPDAARHSSQL
jgi:hypothetical protein